MRFMQRTIAGIRRRGVLGTIDRLASMFEERWFDWRYGTDTVGALSPGESTSRLEPAPDALRYEATRLRSFRHVMARLVPTSENVFVDFGCGKGRVLLAAAQFRFKRVEGVEFAEELCEIARKNIAAFDSRGGLATEIRVVQADAGKYVVPDDADYFYFFNPFGEPVMRGTLANIVQSLKRRPRPATLIYCNPMWKRSVEETGVFHLLGEYVFGEFAVYTNRSCGEHEAA
jgi:SAM-dependent methyltransferase